MLDVATLHGSLADPLLDTMNFLNEVTARYPDAIPLAPGRPYEGLFDASRIGGYIDSYTGYLRRSGQTEQQIQASMFQYGRTKGQIHGLIAEMLANDEDIRVPAEAIVVTVGAQEGMFLVLRALCTSPQDVLLISSPCYIGMTGAARLLDMPFLPVPEGPDGPDPDAVRDVARRAVAAGQRPRAVYLVPDFANPSGASMPVPARKRLLEVAAAEGLLVIEDNPYGYFTRDVEPRPTLKSLDTDGTVVYLGSFAKTCFPGARLGYVLADQQVAGQDGYRSLLADELAKIKSMISVNTPTLSQAVIGGMLVECGCRLRQANAANIAFYRANLELVLNELDRYFPAPRRADLGIRWSYPDGGFFTVLTVPFPADDAALERSAREHGVLWTPMDSFFVGGGGLHQLRVSSSYVPPDQLAEGISRLAAFVADETARAAPVRVS
jgi:(S)-3,5-dihydroxyphenylglycine transaminase